MEIPKQLQNEDFRFVLLGQWNKWKNAKTKALAEFSPAEYPLIDKKNWKPLGKAPYEPKWEQRGYKFNDNKLLNHPHNFGIIGGNGNLRILDIDNKELAEEFEKKIDTYTVKTGSGGRHFYFISDYDENHVLINEIGELRAKNYQVVSAPCRHPSGNYYQVIKDVSIQTISKEDLLALIKSYLREEITIAVPSSQKGLQDSNKKKDTSRSGLEFRKVLALLRKGMEREEIYKKMEAYSKWSTAPEQYRTMTFEKAENLYLQEQEKKKESKKEKEEEVEENEETLEELKARLTFCYNEIVKLLEEYLDLRKEYYPLITVWVIGTYFLDDFETYPYLYLNAMKGSGKTRTLKLISDLAKDGRLLASVTETVMFRTKGTLAIDEFEGLGEKKNEELRELLNTAYKRGVTVIRFKKQKTAVGEEQTLEEFEPFRPIVVANIWGMEDVLGDRCIPITLEKSNSDKTKLTERWKKTSTLQSIVSTLNYEGKCSKCSYVGKNNIIELWNDFVKQHASTPTTPTTLPTLTTLTTLNTLQKIYDTGIDGRYLELGFPLFVVGNLIDEKVFDEILKTFTEIVSKKKEENVMESIDISLYDFVSQELDEGFFTPIKKLTGDFRTFLQTEDPNINERWMGRALKRLNLVIEIKRMNRGMVVRLNYAKAQEKIKIFK